VSFYGCSALPFQPEQNKQPNKMAREVVLTAEIVRDAKILSWNKPKGGKNEKA
jgi:hypothetical protein